MTGPLGTRMSAAHALLFVLVIAVPNITASVVDKTKLIVSLRFVLFNSSWTTNKILYILEDLLLLS